VQGLLVPYLSELFRSPKAGQQRFLFGTVTAKWCHCVGLNLEGPHCTGPNRLTRAIYRSKKRWAALCPETHSPGRGMVTGTRNSRPHQIRRTNSRPSTHSNQYSSTWHVDMELGNGGTFAKCTGTLWRNSPSPEVSLRACAPFASQQSNQFPAQWSIPLHVCDHLGLLLGPSLGTSTEV
jgi:hypothetical protein